MSEGLARFLGSDLLPLYRDGEKLLSAITETDNFSDHSFIIFPFAKVYEGFLKKLFFQIGAIGKEEYESERWRVGKALNPALEKELRERESVYDRIVAHCGGVELADQLWFTWKRGRNQVFHFWPGRSKTVSLEEAKEIVSLISETMEKALVGCRINFN